MRTLVLVLALLSGCAACEVQSPAALPPEECSSPATVGGYEMGNLPVLRTVTLSPGDAVPSNLLNEIQDVLVGTLRSSWSRPRHPRFTIVGSWGTPALVTDSLGKVLVASTTTGSSQGYIEIPFDEGDRITGITIQALGNGTADVLYDVLAGTISGGLVSIASGGITDTNRSNTWGTVSGFSITPTILLAGNTLYIQAIPNASGYSVATVVPVFDRL